MRFHHNHYSPEASEKKSLFPRFVALELVPGHCRCVGGHIHCRLRFFVVICVQHGGKVCLHVVVHLLGLLNLGHVGDVLG